MGKTTGAHNLHTFTMSRKCKTTREQRGNDLSLSLFAWRQLQQRISLYIALSLSFALYNSCNNATIMATTLPKLFALGHIYSNMNLGLFTNIAPMGSLEHIYIYVPSSGSHRVFRCRALISHPCKVNAERTMLGHNRVLGSNARKNGKYTCARQWRGEGEDTGCLRGKPKKREKPRQSTDCKLSLCYNIQ